VRIGEYSGVASDSLRFCFDALVKDAAWSRWRWTSSSASRATACAGDELDSATGDRRAGDRMNRIPLERKVLSENDRIAGDLRRAFQAHGILC